MELPKSCERHQRILNTVLTVRRFGGSHYRLQNYGRVRFFPLIFSRLIKKLFLKMELLKFCESVFRENRLTIKTILFACLIGAALILSAVNKCSSQSERLVFTNDWIGLCQCQIFRENKFLN